MELVNFRKSNKITLDMINNQYLNEEEQKSLYDSIYERVDKIFKILERETLANDDSGISYQIVKNNEIKRDDKYEL